MNLNRQQCPRRKERPQSDITLNKARPRLPRQIGIPPRSRGFCHQLWRELHYVLYMVDISGILLDQPFCSSSYSNVIAMFGGSFHQFIRQVQLEPRNAFNLGTIISAVPSFLERDRDNSDPDPPKELCTSHLLILLKQGHLHGGGGGGRGAAAWCIDQTPWQPRREVNYWEAN